jgi:hypothetical protein
MTERYSRFELLKYSIAGVTGGSFVGALKGSVGSLITPTSLRQLNDELDVDLAETFKRGYMENIYYGVSDVAFLVSRAGVQLGLHSYVVYKIGEDFTNGGSLVSWSLLASNLISGGVEGVKYLRGRKG